MPSSTEPETKTLHHTSPETTYDIILLGWKHEKKVSKILICLLITMLSMQERPA